MKKVLFIVGHHFSGSNILFNILDNNPRVQGFHISPYINALDIKNLTEQKHKFNNFASIYMDELLLNTSLQTKDAYKLCKFIYIIRSPMQTLGSLFNVYKPQFAVNYYCFRLRRICEMAKNTPDSIFLRYEDIPNGLNLIENYLKLKQKLEMISLPEKKDIFIPHKLLDISEQSYERHLAFLKSLPLHKIC